MVSDYEAYATKLVRKKNTGEIKSWGSFRRGRKHVPCKSNASVGACTRGGLSVFLWNKLNSGGKKELTKEKSVKWS